jgi:hypothetical protein
MSSEPDDLLGKANALMARHGHAPAAPYAEIPVLNEVVDFPPEHDELPVLTEYVVTVPPDEEQIEALAASMRDSLLAELQPGIDALIEQRLRDELAPMVERVFDGLRADLQLITREILSEAVHAAVEQELERRR